MRLRDSFFLIAAIGVRFSLNARALSLDDVRQLVCEKSIALLRSRCVLAATKVDVLADGEGTRTETRCGRVRFAARMDAYAAEIGAQVAFHSRAHIG